MLKHNLRPMTIGLCHRNGLPMYKFLLCWRYLRTRYIALASIVSVMLGVATMIVVNSVMSGFTTEMQVRLHGVLSDLVIEVRNMNGGPDAESHMDFARRVAGDSIEAMTPAVIVPAIFGSTTAASGSCGRST